MDALDLWRPGNAEQPWRTDVHDLYRQLRLNLPLRPATSQPRLRPVLRPARTVHAAELGATRTVQTHPTPTGPGATHPTPAGEATHHCKYSQLVRKLDAWVKVATEKLGQLKEQVERREGQDTVKVKVEERAVMTGNEEKPEVKVDAGTGMSPVKTEREETMEVNEYGTKITAARNQPAVQQVKVKVEPQSTMTAIKPKVEYKVGTATKREHRGGSFGFDGAAKISCIEGRVMGTIKQDLEGNIVNKPVGMYSVVQRLKTDPEIHEMAQREDMMKKVRDAEEETRRVKEELRKLKEDMGGLGLGLCGRDGQVRKPGVEPLPAGGAIMMDIDSDTDGGAILELNEIKQPRFLHTATQTDWVGKSQFHKATQFPITHYSSDELRSMSADLVPVKKASLYSGESMQLHVSTQTEWLGHSAMHKAIQFPEITYCKEEEKPKDLPPYVPAANPLPPVIQQWKPVPEVHPPTPAPTPTPASQAPVVTTTTSVTKTTTATTGSATPTQNTTLVKQEPPEESADKIIIPKVSASGSDNQTVVQAVQSVVSAPPTGQPPAAQFMRPLLGAAGAGGFMYPQYASQALYAPAMYNPTYYIPQYSYPAAQYGYLMMGGAAPPRAPAPSDGDSPEPK